MTHDDICFELLKHYRDYNEESLHKFCAELLDDPYCAAMFQQEKRSDVEHRKLRDTFNNYKPMYTADILNIVKSSIQS